MSRDKGRRRLDLMELPAYPLEYGPVPKRRNKHEAKRSLQQTVIEFLDSGEPSARVVGFCVLSRQSMLHALYALNVAHSQDCPT